MGVGGLMGDRPFGQALARCCELPHFRQPPVLSREISFCFGSERGDGPDRWPDEDENSPVFGVCCDCREDSRDCLS